MNEPLPKIQRPATYQDVLDAPPNLVAELVNGSLHLQPRPAFKHGIASSVLGGELSGPFHRGRGGPGGWWIIDEPELHLGEDVLVPDLAGWLRERLPEAPDTAFVSLEPDWVCEVLSPATRKFDLTDKRDVFGNAGVPYLWFVDPIARTLEAFRNNDGVWSLIAALKDDDAVSVAPFEAIEFSLSGLWSD